MKKIENLKSCFLLVYILYIVIKFCRVGESEKWEKVRREREVVVLFEGVKVVVGL